MENVLVLPKRFKVIGLLAAALGILLTLVATQEGLINVYRLLDPKEYPGGGQPYPPNFWEINTIFEYCSIGMMVVGLLCFFLAKEPDEFFYKVRLDSIQWAVAMQVLTGIGMYSYFYLSGNYEMHNTYVAILTSGLIAFWLTFILHYYFVIWFAKKMTQFHKTYRGKLTSH